MEVRSSLAIKQSQSKENVSLTMRCTATSRPLFLSLLDRGIKSGETRSRALDVNLKKPAILSTMYDTIICRHQVEEP